MKVGITGSSGFVGSNLIEYLKGKNVFCESIKLRDVDWKNGLSMDLDAIIHLAGKAHDTSNTSNAEDYYKINRDLTKELFLEFKKSKIRDFIYFSSVKAVKDTLTGELDENVIPEPLTPYGKSKLEAEEFLLSQTLEENRRIFIIRPCMIHGPGNKGNLNLLFNVVKNGIPWPLASYENRRSFLSIENLNYLTYNLLINSKVEGSVFNFSDDSPLSTNELVSVISECLGRSPKLWRINSGIIEMVSKVGDLLGLPLNTERLKKLTESYVVSNRKIKESLNIETLPVSTIDGLRCTINSFLSK